MARPVKSHLLHLIYITAKTTSGGSAQKVVGGNPTSDNIYESYTTSDGIIKQETSRGYYVQTGYGRARCRLVASDNPGYKQAFIKATDDNDNTYFVTKLTAHKATLVRWTNNEAEWLFEDGEQARWTFGNAQAGQYKSVKIENDD